MPDITLERRLCDSFPEEQEQALFPENDLFSIPNKNSSFWIASF
jgi:hypothetical protein